MKENPHQVADFLFRLIIYLDPFIHIQIMVYHLKVHSRYLSSIIVTISFFTCLCIYTAMHAVLEKCKEFLAYLN